MKTIRVAASAPYDVRIGHGLRKACGEALLEIASPGKAALVSDGTVYGLYGGIVETSLARAGFRAIPFVFPPGEASKSLDTFCRLARFLAEQSFSRSDLVVALGGGVTGDLAGFAAAVTLRGIPYVQMPTTLLAAVDASVGGKTAVNLPEGKNLLGAFRQPALVLCDCETFASLPPETFSDGLAESIKHGAICDRALFDFIAGGGAGRDAETVVARCVDIKARVVAEDEFDQGKRQLLNFGHTWGHAVETLSGYAVSHGRAVAMGMAAMTKAAEAMGVCRPGSAAIMEAALRAANLPAATPYAPEALAEAALHDKKRRGDTVTLVLPRSIGDCVLYPVKAGELAGIFRLA